MEIRRLDRAALGPVNNWSQRLVPWAALNAPFEGAWCVVRPGGESQRHATRDAAFARMRSSGVKPTGRPQGTEAVA